MSPIEPLRASAEAQALLRAAEQDWQTVTLLAQHPDAPVSSIGFHVQQYLEKVMKAVLVSRAVTFRRTHDLEPLAALLEECGIVLPAPKEQLRQLSPFAVLIRYEELALVLPDARALTTLMADARRWVEAQIEG